MQVGSSLRTKRIKSKIAICIWTLQTQIQRLLGRKNRTLNVFIQVCIYAGREENEEEEKEEEEEWLKADKEEEEEERDEEE